MSDGGLGQEKSQDRHLSMPERDEYKPPEEQHQDQQDHPAGHTLEGGFEFLARRIFHGGPWFP